MNVTYVTLSNDVYFVCTSHALSTDTEETVGLLVGEVTDDGVVKIHAVMILIRSEKRANLVEISPEQLAKASTEAEKLSLILNKQIRVIGWYHSHPKLSVCPSSIDINTQYGYQLMDSCFIGLIFSVFRDDPTKKGGRLQMTCFQTENVNTQNGVVKRQIEVPIYLVPVNHISNVCMKALIQLPQLLCQEEQISYHMTNQMKMDYLSRLHNLSVYLKSMGKIVELVSGPLINLLEERININGIKWKEAKHREKKLNLHHEEMLKKIACFNSSKSDTCMDGIETNSKVDQIQCSQTSGANCNSDSPSVINAESSDESLVNLPNESLDPDNQMIEFVCDDSLLYNSDALISIITNIACQHLASDSAVNDANK